MARTVPFCIFHLLLQGQASLFLYKVFDQASWLATIMLLHITHVLYP